MSKKVFFLIILLLIQLGFFPHPISAVTSCKDSRIDWDPKLFLEGQIQYVMNLTAENSNTLNTLKGNYVRLLADRGFFNLGGIYTYPPVKVESSKFSFVLTGNLTTGSVHNGVLQWSSTETGTYSDFCSDIVYQVGAVGKCTILDQSIPSKIPPNSSLIVRFVGKPDTDYQLRIDDAIFSSIKTDSGGQGTFPSVVIPGNNGDTKRLVVISFAAGTQSCYKDTKIDSTVSPPAPIPTGPVQPIPAAPAANQCDPKNPSYDAKKCTKGGGETCDAGRGFKTAIGCIHTNPTEFVKDFLKFIIGIGGGLAFLMMLLGVFQMLTSAGNPETLAAGRDRLQSAIIGLLFIIFAVLLLKIIGVDILGIPGFTQ